MTDKEAIIDDLNVAKLALCNHQILTPEMCVKIGQTITSAIDMLKEQEEQEIYPCENCQEFECDVCPYADN